MKRIVLVACILHTLAMAASAQEKLTLSVKETAGIRRFGYPVYAKLTLPREATEKDRFRLLDGGKPIAAQFFLLPDRKSVALDFTANHGPFDQKSYTVEFGPTVEAVADKGGLKLEESKEAYTLRSGGMTYVVPRDLKGLLKEVRDGKKSYLREGSLGLSMRVGKETYPVGGTGVKSRIVRQGPAAVALHFESEEKLKSGGSVRSVVELTFPRSKSWVEVVWTVKPRKDAKLNGLDAGLNLLTVGLPTLVDFGAGSMVYTTLTKDQAALLTARPLHQRDAKAPLWEVLTGSGDTTRSLVRADPERGVGAEGWAHLMDKERCTAVAVEAFGRSYADEIRLAADGTLTIRRSHAVLPLMMKGLRFWLHFVAVPVQVGAVTSPQSMMAPLVVEVK